MTAKKNSQNDQGRQMPPRSRQYHLGQRSEREALRRREEQADDFFRRSSYNPLRREDGTMAPDPWRGRDLRAIENGSPLGNVVGQPRYSMAPGYDPPPVDMADEHERAMRALRECLDAIRLNLSRGDVKAAAAAWRFLLDSNPDFAGRERVNFWKHLIRSTAGELARGEHPFESAQERRTRIVAEVRRRIAAGESQHAVAAALGVSQSMVSRILREP